MFEKEAKERAKDYTDNAKRQVAYECGFLDGVDFVYNKAKDIIRDLLSCLYSTEYDRVSDLEQAEQFLKEVSK